MKKRLKNNIKTVRGMPGAVLLSILVHAALFLLAGTLVVFTVVKKEEKKFEPPQAVERPKMKLKKPKVKIKKTSRPKPTQRIVTKVNRASMPDIQLPEMSGMGDGLVGDFGGFDVMPDLGEVSVFGSGQSIGNDFVGTFYDFKRDRTGRRIPCAYWDYVDIARRFAKDGWKSSTLSRYYKSPKKLYATTFMIPPTHAFNVPYAFGEPEAEDRYWMVHYKGQLVHKEGITFRFMARGDGLMGVRVNGKVVLAAGMLREGVWQPSSGDSFKWWLGNGRAVAGDWITLEPGVPLDMEVIISDGGGRAAFMLVVQEKGVEYPMRTAGGPTFPAFKTAMPSHDLLDAIYRDLVPGEASLTNGPVFCDYDVEEWPEAHVVAERESVEAVLSEPVPADPMRTWTHVSGKTLKARFIVVIGGKAVLESPEGKQEKISLAQLSAEDRNYIELANPPEFKIDFSTQTRPVFSVVDRTPTGITIGYDYRAKVRLRQTSAGKYRHKLCVELFAVGKQIDGERYRLLDRQKSCFIPGEVNQREHEFSGKLIRLHDFHFDLQSASRGGGPQHRGGKPYGYLITVTDPRGEIIAHEESNPWLYENIASLKKLPVGAYMDKTCTRRFPTSPKRVLY